MYKRWEPPSNKRKLRHWLKIIRQAKTWQLLVVLVLLSFLSATLLRLNNLGMIERRDAVIAADKKGDREEARRTLVELQRFVAGHMNTSLEKGVSLKEIFQQDYQTALTAAASTNNPASEVYQKASLECQARFQGGVESFRNDYVACVSNAVSNLPPEQQQEAALPRASAYTYNFSSPLLSLDLAGISVLLTVALGLVIVVRLVALYWLRWLIKRRRKVL